jgi:hypothetical protein
MYRTGDTPEPRRGMSVRISATRAGITLCNPRRCAGVYLARPLGRPRKPSLPGKLNGGRLPASSSHEAAGLTKITIVAAKRPGLMISTVAQQPAVVSIEP